MPSIQPFEPRELGPKPWGTELLIAHTDHYTGKILSMRAGTIGPLQYHMQKNETFHLVSGLACIKFRHEDTEDLQVHIMRPGESIHVPPGAVHQVEAIMACVFFEASTPHFDDRVPVQPVEHL